MEGSIAEKWKDRLGKKVKVSLNLMFKVIHKNKSRKIVIRHLHERVALKSMRNT